MFSKTYYSFIVVFSMMSIIGIIADDELEVIIDAADIVEDIIIYDEPVPKLPKYVTYLNQFKIAICTNFERLKS